MTNITTVMNNTEKEGEFHKKCSVMKLISTATYQGQVDRVSNKLRITHLHKHTQTRVYDRQMTTTIMQSLACIAQQRTERKV